MPVCPSCRRDWPDGREVCGDCLASLVDDLDATITCPECGHVCPARMHTCPSCLALLRPGEVDVTEDVSRLLMRGLRMHRPTGREPFALGAACTVLRLHPESPLVICGPDGLIEANVAGRGIAARPPLVCSTDATILFRLEVYEPTPDAIVAIGGDGAPLATYLRSGSLLRRVLEVRDETSAPVARLVPRQEGWSLMETGSDRVLAALARADVEDELYVDDQWSLTPVAGSQPLELLALVAMPVVAKVLLGRVEPTLVGERPERDWDRPPSEMDDTLGPLGRTIVESWDDD